MVKYYSATYACENCEKESGYAHIYSIKAPPRLLKHSLAPVPGSKLAEAVTYAQNQRPYLSAFLEYGEVDISNNFAENAIRPFAVGRKNWLSSDTTKGAESSAIVYTLVETAKENKLDPYRYLLWVLRSAPALSQSNESWAENLLPANAPQECLVPQ